MWPNRFFFVNDQKSMVNCLNPNANGILVKVIRKATQQSNVGSMYLAFLINR